LPESEFEPALRGARAGRAAEAIPAVLATLHGRAPDDASVALAANALVEIGRLAELGGDLGAAERALAEALALRPGYADVHYRRACLLMRGGRVADARRALESSLAINPRYVAARLELALLDARQGLVGDALESLRTLSESISVDDPRVFRQGMQRLERAEWDEADSLLRRALHLQDSALQEELQGVRAHLEDGRAREAIAALRSLVPRYAVYPDLHALLGRAQLALGHYDDAIVSLSLALELQPSYHGARVLLAHALEGAGQLEQAQEQVAWVLQDDPAHAEALERRRDWASRAARGARRAAVR